MLKHMLNMIIEPSYHIHEIRNEYGDRVSFFLITIIVSQLMFLNAVVYDTTLESFIHILILAGFDSLVLGTIVSIISLLLISFVLKITYSLMDYKLTSKMIRSCLAWGSIPLLLGNMVSIVIRLFEISNFDSKYMTSAWIWYSKPILVITMISFIWSIVIISINIKEILTARNNNVALVLLIIIGSVLPMMHLISDRIYFYIQIYIHKFWY